MPVKKKVDVKKVVKKNTPIKKVVAKKEPKVDFEELVTFHCQKNENLILMDLSDRSAFIIKKKNETVREELCAGTMNPIERFHDMTFFHFFIIRWGNKKIPKNSMMGNLEERGLPIYYVEIEYDIIKAIQDAWKFNDKVWILMIHSAPNN